MLERGRLPVKTVRRVDILVTNLVEMALRAAVRSGKEEGRENGLSRPRSLEYVRQLEREEDEDDTRLR